MTAHAIRASILHCVRDPGLAGDRCAIEHIRDAITLIDNGRIVAVAPAATLLPNLGADVLIDDQRGKLLLPGFIDTHVHYPQVDVIASYGAQLLDWLNTYTFPAETQFADRAHADAAATFFLDRLLENGTTTASVFCTVHPQSVDAFFSASEARGLRMIAGKCLMDRHAPDGLRDTATTGIAETRALIERWHGHARSLYAITPRFAATSTREQLKAMGQLAREFPSAYIQSHVAENKAEIAWIAELFPEYRSYLDVYDQFGLLRDRSIYAHCIYLDDADRARMSDCGATPAFCPTSNLFIGSGLYNLAQAVSAGNRVSLGSDVGGGTSYSMLRTLGEAYKIQQLQGVSLSPAYALYLATLGGARALSLDDRIGSMCAGKEADLVLLDPAATPLLARRTALRDDPLDTFFAMMTLGDDRAVAATYAGGQCVHRKMTAA
ncbi:MAG: guanine deaminase [Betaproteobacteria bacterium]|nr:MAG: guanine deaminase [Betaproteobacteria bacterium]